MEQLDRPLFVLIDDAQLLKFGRTLSRVEKPLTKMVSKLSLVFTSANVDVPALQLDQTAEIAKNQWQHSGVAKPARNRALR